MISQKLEVDLKKMPQAREYYNPLTARPIKKGSKSYNNLIKNGVKPIKVTSEYANLHNRMPKSKRQSIKNKCGSKCFLASKELKYPICNTQCEKDCSLVVTAKRKAILVLSNKNTKKASKTIASKVLTRSQTLLKNC